jgi:tartrate-resistant acid phosphatase type 5
MSQRYSRREFLRQSFCFSALALGHRLDRLFEFGGGTRIEFAPDAHHLFAIGDWGEESHQSQQLAVAHAMREYATNHSIRAESLVLLGDNWYGWLMGGLHSSRWKDQFEDVYSADVFPGRCYAVLGNHDYEKRPGSKAEAQLEYAAEGKSRWTMPAKWYSFWFPQRDPMVRFIALDSNFPHRAHFFRTPTMTHQEMEAQGAWLRNELSQSSTALYTAVLAHHPIFSNGDHGDTPSLIRDWDPLLRERKVHLYLSGHDHDLQHLEFEASPTSYVISGGGGAKLRNLKRQPSARGPYGLKVAGFTHLEVNRERIVVRLVDSNGQVLHGFRKTPAGEVFLG